jgi:hypothetical protein
MIVFRGVHWRFVLVHAGALYRCRMRNKFPTTLNECSPDGLKKANESAAKKAVPVSFLHRVR